MRTRGAKVAMTVALRSPKFLGAMISVDNAPVDASLNSNFYGYAQGMREIEEAGVKKQVEADAILKKYEVVSLDFQHMVPWTCLTLAGTTNSPIPPDQSRSIARRGTSPPAHPNQNTRRKP